MATYTIVASTTDPLGPGEIASGSTILASDGDVYIIDSSADIKVTFEAAGGGPANFDVVINDSNANTFDIKVNDNLTPTITVADNVDISNFSVSAGLSDATNFNVGNNVQFGGGGTANGFTGSDAGVSTIHIGDDFTSTGDFKVGQVDDVITIGDRATFDKIALDGGDDAITIGSGVTVTEIAGGLGNDVLTTQTAGVTTKNVETVNLVCYAPGTLIDTPESPRAVEDLQIGDLVLTVDHGAQAIRWVRSSDHPLDGFEDDKKPVLIQAGALGSGLPVQDLIVSPQHRILVGGGGQLAAYFRAEAFVPAKSLTSLPGIRHMKGKRAVTWIHFACDRHEVILANGCQSESLLLGPMVMDGLGFLERQNVIDIFGAADTPDAALNGPSARECLAVAEVRRQLKKQAKLVCHRRAREIRKWGEDAAMERHEAELLREVKFAGEARKRRVM